MESHKDTTVNMLKEMGFEQSIIDKAYNRSDIKTVEGLINFIDANPNLQNEPDTPAGNKMDEEKSQNAGKELPGQSITALVDQELVAQILSLGHSKDVSEKAIFMTQNTGVDAAKKWIEEHKSDPDFTEPLFIVRQNPNMPKLTPEEAKKKAKELQAKIREDRAKKDKQSELEAEISRLKSGKNLTQAQRDLDDLQTKLEMGKLQKDRDEKEAAKRKILDEIEKDRKDKGLKPMSQVQKSLKEVYPDIIKKMHRVYTDPEIVKTCLKTINIYLSKLEVTQKTFFPIHPKRSSEK